MKWCVTDGYASATTAVTKDIVPITVDTATIVGMLNKQPTMNDAIAP